MDRSDGPETRDGEQPQQLVRSVDAPTSALAKQDRVLLAIGAFIAGGALLAVMVPAAGSVVLGVGIAIGLLVRGRKMFSGRR